MKDNGALKEDVLNYVKSKFDTSPEYLWKAYPTYAVLRHPNKKWYAAIMSLPKEKIGLVGEGEIDVVTAKCDSILQGGLLQEKGFLPAYHMNKEHWVSVILDGSMKNEDICRLIEESFALTAPKTRHQKTQRRSPDC